MYREAFLRAVAHLGMSRSDAAAVVETISGQHFDDCGWAELQPVVERLQIILDQILARQCTARSEDV